MVRRDAALQDEGGARGRGSHEEGYKIHLRHKTYQKLLVPSYAKLILKDVTLVSRNAKLTSKDITLVSRSAKLTLKDVTLTPSRWEEM